MRMAAGGGYGNPRERDPQLVLEDMLDGPVSEKAAREVYGVIIDTKHQKIDATATTSLRNSQNSRDQSNFAD